MTSAVLLVAHGTVDDLDDLPAFVTNVRRGRPPPAELVAELRRRYEAIGGRSPVNATNAVLAGKLSARLGRPVAWANRLWRPYVSDVLADLVRRGASRVAVVPLAQHSAHVYAEDARRAASGLAVDVACARNWGGDPGLCAAFAERIVRALGSDAPLRERAGVLMTAHSLPRAVVDRGDPYEREVRAAAREIARRVQSRAGDGVSFALAFQSQTPGSRAADGRPVEWLGPGLAESLDELASRGVGRVVVAPVGFLADHVEVLYDLDVEARAKAEERHLIYTRAESLNADDDLVGVLAGLAEALFDGA